jgi:hypothetical protein
MAVARIRTYFPEEISELCEALIEAGYTVETVRPDEVRIAPADLEIRVEKLPVIDAWRHIPDADCVFVSPGTPESRDIRSALGKEISREPLLARLVIEGGERYTEISRWTARQARELRARMHEFRLNVQEIRQKWTPPREYHSPAHLEPAVPSSLDHGHETRIDEAIERARLEAAKREEERRRKEQEDQLRLAEQARVMEENRRRAREAAEAKALLEEQKKIEAMVRTTESLRDRVVRANLPAPRPVLVQKPRQLLRTRRDRAFVRAGLAAFALSMGLAVLGAEALHPRPASAVIPNAVAPATVPFTKQQTGSPSIQAQVTPAKPPSTVPPFVAAAPTQTTSSDPQASIKPTAGKTHRLNEATIMAQDEVIVHKTMLPHRAASKPKGSIIHYSDLD